MRNTIFILICFTAMISCKSQVYPIESEDYIHINNGMFFKDTNNNFEKFEGTWEFVDANRRLRIVLEKIEDYEDEGYFSDVIVGNLIYEQNGVEIINTLTNPSTSQGSNDIYHIKMFVIRNPNLIGGYFEDPIRSKWTDYSVALEYSSSFSLESGNLIENLEWYVQINSFYNPDGDADAEQALRVPSGLTLTKI